MMKMSSPTLNLKTMNTSPKKVMNGSKINSKESRNHNRSEQEETVDIKKNTDSDINKEKMINQVYERMSSLENQVKDVKEQLLKAVEVINRKDVEIEMLKEQLFQQGREQTHPNLSTSQQLALEDEYLREQYDKLNEVMADMSPKKNKLFFFKEDFISPGDGYCENKTQGCEEFSKLRRMPKERSLYEEMNDDFTMDTEFNKKKSKLMYEDATSKFENDVDIEGLVMKRVGDYPEESSNSTIDENQDLESEYIRLADQIAEMEQFLADYGLIWVGEKKIKNDVHGEKIIQTTVGFTPNFDKVIMIVGGLNERVSSEKHIKVRGNEAKFQRPDMLNLTLYQDGMQLEGSPFRRYSTESVEQFFHDLEDGYYPTELKEKYPEGVIFKMTDKRSINYDEANEKEVVKFSGSGYRLGTLETSDEEPDGKERKSERSQSLQNLDDRMHSNRNIDENTLARLTFLREKMKRRAAHLEKETNDRIAKANESVSEADTVTETLTDITPYDKDHSLTQIHKHLKEYVSAEDSGGRTEGFKDMHHGKEDSDKYVARKREHTDDVEVKITYLGKELHNVSENKVIQTGIHQEEVHNMKKRSLETQTDEMKQKSEKEIAEKPFYRFGDKIDITNISYHEAPLSGQEVERHIFIDLETQSEPVLSPGSSKLHQRNRKSSWSHRQKFSQRDKNARRLINDNISEGSEASYHKHPTHLTSEYEEAYSRNANNIRTVLAKEHLATDAFDQTKKYEHMEILGRSAAEPYENKEMNRSKRPDATDHLSEESLESDSNTRTIPINKRTSNTQIEFTMKTSKGKETYVGYFYPEDTISKILLLAKLDADQYQVTVIDQVLDINVPLKNYNIDGDVSLTLRKKESDSSSKVIIENKILPKTMTYEKEIDSPDEEDDVVPEITKDGDEEGYSS